MSICRTSHLLNQVFPSETFKKMDFFKAFHKVKKSGHYNFECCKIPLETKLNIPFFRFMLNDYDDLIVVDFLEYGFPIGFSG